MDNISHGTLSNGAIALAYFIIPLTLIPLLRPARREIWLNLLLAIAFVFSCGVGHVLNAFHIYSPPWHWVTAAVSWMAVVVLLSSRSRLRYLGDTFHLLETTWEGSITGKLLCERHRNDLTILKINPAAVTITENLLQVGDHLCEKMPSHRQQVYPYKVPLIDLYFQTLNSGESQRLEFYYDGEISGWYLTIATALSPNLLYITFSEISGFIHDPLTGLYNRRILEMDIDGWQACAYIDLDRFKLINDQRGHQLGDQLLVAVAAVLQSHIQPHDGIAIRVGGDEFVLLLPALESDAIAELITAVLQDILAIDIQGAGISASIGIAQAPIDAFGDDAPINRLLQAAETALREAKRNRHSDHPQHGIRVWDLELAQRRLRQITLEAYLYQRSTETEFWLAYQPICQMDTGEVIGAEALIRWDSAHLGSISPSEFIPVAEMTGLIHRISDWVLCHALEQLAIWQQLAPEFSLSINISPFELEDDDFIERMSRRVSEVGIKRKLVGIEITERGIYRDFDRYLQSLQALREMSLRLKVDDFGTGQSGLAQLLQFRFDDVKVDRCFIPAHANNLEKVAICQAIATLSQGLQFGLVAEGVEQVNQRDLMLAMNYHYGQGYWFARPMAAQRFTTLLQNGGRLW